MRWNNNKLFKVEKYRTIIDNSVCEGIMRSVVNKLFLSLLFTLERKKTDTRQE